MSEISLVVSSDFGYIVIVICASWILMNWLALQVVRARKLYGVSYPAMYSETDMVFNCIQRAHQNTIEGYPMFLVLLIFGGLQYPRICAVAGFTWVISRVVYAKGYYTGTPQKRNRGGFGYVGLLILFFSTVAFALSLLGWM